MHFVKTFKLILLGLIVAWVAGCSSKGGSTDTTGATTGGAASGATVYSAEQQARMDAERMAAEQAARVKSELESLIGITTFYFDFDQSVIKPEARAALEAHAQKISSTNASVVLEGHADERGTREYNLALGERRAEAVARYLTALGVSSAKIESVSYGEERPASMAHDEAGWSLNRRVELRYAH